MYILTKVSDLLKKEAFIYEYVHRLSRDIGAIVFGSDRKVPGFNVGKTCYSAFLRFS